MIVRLYGTRGSTPVCESGFREFGGNTSCVLIDGPERVCILDAGTGIRQLGKEMLESDEPRFRRPVTVMFSHFHWDHIQGFPFFGPAYDPARHFVVLAMGVRPRKDVVDRFKEAFPDARVIGDAARGGRILDATQDAYGQAFVFEP